MRLPVAIKEARACTLCEPHLPLGANPLLQGSARSRLLLIGQAPGAKTHEAGVPWRDVSGDRLRDWLGISEEHFYDPALVAHMPMGFCYPGKGTSGDLPPREECAPAWHPRLLRAFRSVELTLYLGAYAFGRYLCDEYATMTDAVADFRSLLPTRFALAHPSPRNRAWLKRNPWFEREALPALRTRVREVLGDT